VPIRSFRSKSLAQFWNEGRAGKLPQDQVARIERRLSALDAAETPEDLDLPGFFFHALKGERAGSYSIRVTGNWRITFRWDGKDAVDVDHEDYH
jgi:proteic killer suppression protein